MKRHLLIWILMLLAMTDGWAVKVSGRLSDSVTGESLVGAYVYVEQIKTGTATDANGVYTLDLPSTGTYSFQLVYVGYVSRTEQVTVTGDRKIDFPMEEEINQIEEIVLEGQATRRSLAEANIGTEKLSVMQVRKLPALMGEVDVIKAIQLLPGVQASSEGSSSYNVRGGSSDQNMVLLDQASVYNPSHFLGFFSVFNNDVVKDAVLYKGDIPAVHGGRLSSVMEVVTNDDVADKFTGRGGIGLITSRLLLDGPIVKDHLSVWASGRVFYAGLLLPMMSDPAIRQAGLTFYDVNSKITARINDKHHLYLSGYVGQDFFKYEALGRFDYSNKAATLRWAAIWRPKFVTNTYLTGSWYDFKVAGRLASLQGSWTGDIDDYGVRQEFVWTPDTHNKLKFGVSSSYKIVHTGYAEMIINDDTDPLSITIPLTTSVESAVFASVEQQYGRWTLKYGLRGTLFNNLDSAQNNCYYWNLEPRAGVAWRFYENMSLKAGYSRTTQYLHQIKTTTAGTPMDL
ncbi:MAG: TonB-dependent receptor [Paludibacteraceae bacterium]|nr:TonB-dependent receptor [Paludibacteraceae bacterium]